MSFTFSVASEVEFEVFIEIISLRRVSINNKLHIVPHSISGCVNSVLIGYLRHEIGRCIDVAPIYERWAVEITEERRSDGIVRYLFGSVDIEPALVSMCSECAGGVGGIDVDEARRVSIVYVARHGECEFKSSANHAVGSVVQNFLSVVEPERTVGFIILLATGDEFASVTHGCGHRSAEVVYAFASLSYVASHLDYTSGFEGYLLASADGFSIYRIDNGFQCGQVERQSRVAE